MHLRFPQRQSRHFNAISTPCVELLVGPQFLSRVIACLEDRRPCHWCVLRLHARNSSRFNGAVMQGPEQTIYADPLCTVSISPQLPTAQHSRILFSSSRIGCSSSVCNFSLSEGIRVVASSAVSGVRVPIASGQEASAGHTRDACLANSHARMRRRRRKAYPTAPSRPSTARAACQTGPKWHADSRPPCSAQSSRGSRGNA